MKLLFLSILMTLVSFPTFARSHHKNRCEQIEMNTLDKYDKLDADLHYWRQVMKMSQPGTPTHINAVHQARKLSKKIAKYVAYSQDECNSL